MKSDRQRTYIETIVYGEVGIATLLHFLVDGLCACALYLLAGTFNGWNPIAFFVVYNVLAFLTQPLTGICADKEEVRHWLLLTADALLATGAVLSAILAASFHTSIPVAGLYLTAIVLGLGNSLFHVWGGKETVCSVGNDMPALGCFVSTGALGLAVGIVFCSWTLLFVLLGAICVLTMLYASTSKRNLKATTHEKKASPLPQRFPRGAGGLLLAAVVAFVVIRSLTGEAFSASLTKTDSIILLLGATSMMGKMAGGWLARWGGLVPMMMVAVAGSLLCYLLRESHLALLLLGLFLVNTTMPVTLYLANAVLKHREGLAFGLLAAALIPGFLIALLLK